MILQNVSRLSECWEIAKASADIFKNCAEAFAWLCAGGFFLYKTLSGYLLSNLSLSINCQRESSDAVQGVDHLFVTAILKKGDKGAVALHDIRAQVSPVALGEEEWKQMAGAYRLTFVTTAADKNRFELKNSPSVSSPLLKLPPGDETSFSTWFLAPSGVPCTVIVTVLGGWRWHLKTHYQWRASAVSPPVKQDNPEHKIVT